MFSGLRCPFIEMSEARVSPQIQVKERDKSVSDRINKEDKVFGFVLLICKMHQ